MKKLSIQLFGFAAFFIMLNMSIVLWIGMLIVKNDTAFRIDKSTEILILGNSYNKVALNDSIIPHSENISGSGEMYFYSYLKLRAFLESNTHIKTVILNYPSLSDKHNKYYYDNTYIINKFPKFFYLMNASEMYELFFSNPNSVLRAIFTIPINYFSISLKNRFSKLSYKNLDIGGYFHYNVNFLDEDRARVIKENELSPGSLKEFKFSEIQEKYLIEFYNLSEQSKLNLILFVPPVDSIILNQGDFIKHVYIDFYNKNLSNAKLLDYSEFELPDSCRADCEHLNYKGARIISEDIKNRL